MNFARLVARLRIAWFRRAAKYWYSESLAHRECARLHDRQIYRCLTLGNARHQRALALEAELNEARS